MRTCPGLDEIEVADLDIIFAKAKAKGERILTYDEVWLTGMIGILVL